MEEKRFLLFSNPRLIYIFLLISTAIIFPLFYLQHWIHVDEGTFLSIGRAISKGDILYKDIIDIKPPGIFYLASFIFKIGGYSFIATRLVVYFVHFASAVIIYFLGKKIHSERVGIISSFFFLVLVYTPVFEGYYYLTEPFAIFFILLSVYLFFKDGFYPKLLSGIFLGIAILFKQTSVLLLLVFLPSKIFPYSS